MLPLYESLALVSVLLCSDSAVGAMEALASTKDVLQSVPNKYNSIFYY